MSRKIEDIDVDNIIFSKPKTKSNNKFLYVYSEKKSLVLKMPKMRLPFGASKDTYAKKNQFVVDLSFENNKELLESFEKLDKAVIKKVQEEYYPEKQVEEVASMFTSCIKRSNNPAFSPSFRAKIVTQDDVKIKCDLYESEKNDEGRYPKIDLNEKGGETYLLNVVNRGSSIESIVECIGLWFMNDKFGLSYKINQIKIFPKVTVECEFIDSSSETSNSEVDFLGD